MYGAWVLLGVWQLVLVKIFRRFIEVDRSSVIIPYLIITVLFLVEHFFLMPVYEDLYQGQVKKVVGQVVVRTEPQVISCYANHDFGIVTEIESQVDRSVLLWVNSPHFDGGRLDEKYTFKVMVNDFEVYSDIPTSINSTSSEGKINLMKGVNRLELLAILRPEYSIEEYLKKWSGSRFVTDEMRLGEPSEKEHTRIELRAPELGYGTDTLYETSIKWPAVEFVQNCP